MMGVPQRNCHVLTFDEKARAGQMIEDSVMPAWGPESGSPTFTHKWLQGPAIPGLRRWGQRYPWGLPASVDKLVSS